MNLATSAFSKLKLHLAGWRTWELNPVVVKELRQAVRSWSVTGMLLLFLAVLFCTALTFLVTQSLEFGANQRLGAQIFQVFTAILTGASLIFIPLYVGVRLAAERQDSNLDLLYITTLTPSRIIRGKFLCGAYMIVLFFSASMPFMAFTNLLRGVDLPTVAFILVYLFLVICIAIQVAIFIACLPISKWFKILIGLAGVAGMIPTTAGLTYSFYSMMQSGIGSMMIGTPFWTVFFTVSGCVVAAVVLLYFLSVGLISPLSANRALPIRAYITFIWIVGGLVSARWVFKARDAGPVVGWCVATLIVMAFALAVVVSNQDQLSLRVKRSIPSNGLARLFAFLFFNGAAGGLVWTLLISAGTFAFAAFVVWNLPTWLPGARTLTGQNREEFASMLTATILYGFAYALTALFIHRQFLARRPAKLAGIFAILLPGVWALIPNIALFFGNRLSFRSLEATQLGSLINVYIVRDADQRLAHVICAGLWFGLMLILNSRWFIRQWREFRPLDKLAAVPQVQQAVPPTIPTQPSAL